jgi:hypothetical protein
MVQQDLAAGRDRTATLIAVQNTFDGRLGARFPFRANRDCSVRIRE